MSSKDSSQKCSVVIIADGFSEVEAIGILSTLRQAGIYSKSVGLTSGLIKGAHGMLLMPDLTLADLPGALDVKMIALIVLPGGERNLSRLDQDPRVHRLIRDVVASEGRVATNAGGERLVRSALGQDFDVKGLGGAPISLRYGLDQPIEAFAQDLIRRLG